MKWHRIDVFIAATIGRTWDPEPLPERLRGVTETFEDVKKRVFAQQPKVRTP
jgi:hypothetical protein